MTIEIKKQRFNIRAEVANLEQRKHLWAQLEAAPMFARYEKKTSRAIPMILLQLVLCQSRIAV